MRPIFAPRSVLLLLPLAVLTACSPGARDAAGPAPGETRPEARPVAIGERRPPQNARTVEQFDVTTAEERAAAATAASGGARLGATVASLGDPSRGGFFWLETPLVSAPGSGRVVYPGSGKAAQVDLIPIDGPRTAGSRISLAAMRLIGAPLTGLPEIEVYSGG